MSSNTPNLNLLKKNPATDGNETFNVQTMLNENWDKIDEAIGDLAEGHSGALVLSSVPPANPTTDTFWYEDLGDSLDLGGETSLVFGNGAVTPDVDIWFEDV